MLEGWSLYHASATVTTGETGRVWVAVGMLEEGVSLLQRVVEEVGNSGDTERAARMREILDAIRDGWDVLSAGAYSFAEAAARRAEPAAEQSPAHPGGTLDREDQGCRRSYLSKTMR